MIVTSSHVRGVKRWRRAAASTLFLLLMFQSTKPASASPTPPCSVERAEADLHAEVPNATLLDGSFISAFQRSGDLWRIAEPAEDGSGRFRRGLDEGVNWLCRDELIFRTRFEQALRVWMHENGYDWEVMAAVDSRNTAFLRTWLDRPNASEQLRDKSPFGATTTSRRAALRLALHARDAAVQQAVLDHFDADEIRRAPDLQSRVDYARLVDRVAVNRGLPQVYGTQRWMDGACTRLFDIEDVDLATARRDAMGLEPLDRSSLCPP